MRGEFVIGKEFLRNLPVEGRKVYSVRSEDKIVLLAAAGRNSRSSTLFNFGN